MEPPSRDDPEHVKMRYWRAEIVKMSQPELSKVSGFSVSTIADMEAGMNRSTKTPLDPNAVKRYRMACAAVTLGCKFDWLSLRMIPDAPVEIRLFR